MSWTQWALLALVFVFVAGAAAGAALLLAPDRARQRLDKVVGDSRQFEVSRSTISLEADEESRVQRLLKQAGAIAAPDAGAEQAAVAERFVHAGLRSADAPMLFAGARAVLTFALPLLGFLILAKLGGTPLASMKTAMVCMVLAAVGYYAPESFLRQKIASRQLEIFEGLPDALDLMTVCVEAGLGLESAMTRVADDLRSKYPVLSEELRAVNLELRAGADREMAMRNLAHRTGVEEVHGFVTMMLQAERFGTSIATSLRVLSDQLRTKRRQKAEETASKMSLKMMVPLVMCIFPALMVVLLGPAIIQLIKAFSGHH